AMDRAFFGEPLGYKLLLTAYKHLRAPSILGYTACEHNTDYKHRWMEGTLQKLRRSIVIHSPQSGRYEKLSQALTYLQEFGVEVIKNISVAELDNQPPQGGKWRDEGIDIAIAAGGDGL